MTGPIELLEERLREINEVKTIAEENELNGKEMKELMLMYNKYNVCIDILKIALNERFILKGELIKSSMALFIKQERKIWNLERKLINIQEKI